LTLNPDTKSESPVELAMQTYTQPQLFFVNKKKAVQSKIHLFANGDNYSKELEPVIDAFNLYFGGDFSGLVLQEIREYRSLAYSASARYRIPRLNGKPCNFSGFVGTQADKTTEALGVFKQLIDNMPAKTDRLEMIKSYLTATILTNRPNFRELSETIVDWQHRGYNEDPGKSKIVAYRNMKFDDIMRFYREAIHTKALVISIVGSKSKMDMMPLKNYGKFTVIKEKKLFTE